MPKTDVRVENHGNLFLFRPKSVSGKRWIEANMDAPDWWLVGRTTMLRGEGYGPLEALLEALRQWEEQGELAHRHGEEAETTL